MAKPKRGDNLHVVEKVVEKVHGEGLDIALEYIENEIRKLECRKNELEQMSERLIAKHDLLEREKSLSRF